MKKIVEALNAYRYRFRSREELRDAVGHVLERHGLGALQGHLFGHRHVDFMVGGWAVLVTVDGGLEDVTRSAMRASSLRDVRGVLVVTCRMLHTRLAPAVWGKPAVVVNVGAPLGVRRRPIDEDVHGDLAPLPAIRRHSGDHSMRLNYLAGALEIVLAPLTRTSGFSKHASRLRNRLQ